MKMHPRLLFALLCLGVFLTPVAAQAVPVTVSVEDWKTTDGNFGFSVLHDASNGGEIDGALFLMSGSITYEVNPTGVLTGDLVGDVLSVSGIVQLNGAGTLELSGVLDFGVASGDLIGELDYVLTTGGGSTVESGTFFFFNNDYTNGTCDANGLCGDLYRLWGNNWDNVAAGLDPPTDRVLRGIDLGGVIAPIPEPGAGLLFGAAFFVVGWALRRDARLPH